MFIINYYSIPIKTKVKKVTFIITFITLKGIYVSKIQTKFIFGPFVRHVPCKVDCEIIDQYIVRLIIINRILSALYQAELLYFPSIILTNLPEC